MIEVVAVFLGGSLVLYVLLGGADFGAGILELFVNRKTRGQQKKIINEAMGPVWEVNHIWLIIAVVILFNAFPQAYSRICITFHIPLTLVLVGIIFRGCAFAFRNYDAYKDRAQKYYSLVFEVSSLFTPFSLGLILGGILIGKIPSVEESFYTAYVAPWFNFFSFLMGVFLCCLVTYIASVYLIGETRKSVLRRQFVFRAKAAGVVTIVMGAVLLETAFLYESEVFSKFYSDPISMACVFTAIAMLVPIWKTLPHPEPLFPRLFVGAQVTLLALGWFKLQFPYLIAPSETIGFEGLSIYKAAAPPDTLNHLLFALAAGSVLIFPVWIYLVRVFKNP